MPWETASGSGRSAWALYVLVFPTENYSPYVFPPAVNWAKMVWASAPGRSVLAVTNKERCIINVFCPCIGLIAM